MSTRSLRLQWCATRRRSVYKLVVVVVINSSSTRIFLSLSLIVVDVGVVNSLQSAGGGGGWLSSGGVKELPSTSISEGVSEISVAGDEVTEEGIGFVSSFDMNIFGVTRPSNDESGLGHSGDGVCRWMNDGEGFLEKK